MGDGQGDAGRCDAMRCGAQETKGCGTGIKETFKGARVLDVDGA